MSKAGQDIKVKVFRFDPSADREPYYSKYTVPYNDQETIMGVLEYIGMNYSPDLAYRESCRIGNCKGCIVRVNGKGVIACRERLMDFEQEELVLDPINKEKVIRDLVCEI